MNGNPFFVSADMTQGITALRQGLMQMQQQRRQEQMQQAAIDAYNSGDLNKVAEVSLRYPEIAQNLQYQMNARDQKAQDVQKRAFTNVLTDPNNVEQHLQEYKKHLIDMNQDPSEVDAIIDTVQTNPKEGLQQLEHMYAVAYPTEYKSWRTSMQDKEAPVVYQHGRGDMQGYVFNPQKGEWHIDPKLDAELKAKAEAQAQRTKEQGVKTLSINDIRGINSDVDKHIRPAVQTRQSYDKLVALRKGGSNADRRAAMIEFMRLNDPNSVVREGEQEMAQKTGGRFDALVNIVNSSLMGEPISDSVFNQFIETARTIANTTAANAKSSTKSYLDTLGNTLPTEKYDLFMARVPTQIGTKKKPAVVKQKVEDKTIFNQQAAKEKALRTQAGYTEEQRNSVLKKYNLM